jgi:hypothetical protein
MFSPAGMVCRATAGECDVAETCDGASPVCPDDAKSRDACGPLSCTGLQAVCDGTGDDCPGTFGGGDDDGDGICDALDYCTDVDGQRTFVEKPASKLVVGKIMSDTDPKNDTLKLAASFVLPEGRSFADFDPAHDGALVALQTVIGGYTQAVAVFRLFPRAYDGKGSFGWLGNGKGTVWRYIPEDDSKRALRPNGVDKMVVTDKSSKTPRLVQVKLQVKAGEFDVATAGVPPVRVTVALLSPDSVNYPTKYPLGLCAHRTFGVDECTTNQKGDTTTCK